MDEDDQLLHRLREVVEAAPDAARFRGFASVHVPCLFTMPLDTPGEPPTGRVEWCRIDAGTPHAIHVSRAGVYRWNDDGTLLETPHVASTSFRDFYRQHPDGQALFRPEDGPTGPTAPVAGGIDYRDVPDHLRGFARFSWQWKALGNLPGLQCYVRRFGLLIGFVLGVLITVAVIAAVVAAILVLAWFVLAYFSAWLTT